jgi:hypothetical protein
MKNISIIFLQILAVCATMYIIINYYPKHGTVRYDCSIAEISPDFPLEVREQCRKLNMEKIK